VAVEDQVAMLQMAVMVDLVAVAEVESPREATLVARILQLQVAQEVLQELVVKQQVVEAKVQMVMVEQEMEIHYLQVAVAVAVERH
jgi:hypothetical protein